MKKKKLLALLLTVVMMVSLFSVTAFAAAGEADTTELPTVGEDTKAITCNGVEYDDFATALSTETSPYEITLNTDIAEGLKVDTGKTVTLNLNGHNITATDAHAIENHGTVTVTGTGDVTAKTKDKAAVANFPDAVATLDGGNFHADNWYTIKNLGTMTINAPVDVSIGDPQNKQSLVDNGWYNASGNTVPDLGLTFDSTKKATLTINGGTFTANKDNMQCVKNDDCGELIINDGTFKKTGSGCAVFNPNKATINGGTFTSEQGGVIANGYSGENDLGELTITGGTFTAGESGDQDLFALTGSAQSGHGKLTVTGGEFNGTLDECSGSTPSEKYKYDVDIQAGTFSNKVPDAYLEEGTSEASLQKSGGDTTYYVGKPADVADILEEKVAAGDTIEVQKGDLTLENVTGDVTVKNSADNTSGKVTVNGEVASGTGGVKTHNHQAGEEYFSDATFHWKECTVENCGDKIMDKAEHEFGNGVASADGITYTCKVCGYTDIKPAIDTSAHTHDYVTAYNTTSHWNACTVDGCTAPVVDKADHVFKEEVVVNPTRNSKGVKTLTCSCGYSKIELLPELKNLIIGTCQIPNPDGSGGFLMGLETSENPNQSYQYEMQIYDCTQETWVYGTDLCGVPETSFWTTWNPIYGYYWTLFRVYDSNGVLLDQIIYGFENI